MELEEMRRRDEHEDDHTRTKKHWSGAGIGGRAPGGRLRGEEHQQPRPARSGQRHPRTGLHEPTGGAPGLTTRPRRSQHRLMPPGQDRHLERADAGAALPHRGRRRRHAARRLLPPEGRQERVLHRPPAGTRDLVGFRQYLGGQRTRVRELRLGQGCDRLRAGRHQQPAGTLGQRSQRSRRRPA